MSQFAGPVFGINGGGTRTTGRICFADQQISSQVAAAGPSNPRRVGLEAAASNVLSVVAELDARLGTRAPVAAALAGTGDPVWAAAMRDKLQQILDRPVFLTTDAAAALESLEPQGAAVALISGTGSIAFGRDALGVIHRSGGHLTPGGDPGSASAIGYQALERFRENKASVILCGFMNPLPLDSPPAAFAEVVDQAATAGALDALAILRSAADDLSRLVLGVISQGEFPPPTPLGFFGGVLENSALTRGFLLESLRESECRLMPGRPRLTPEAAAVELARKSGTIGP